MKNTIFLVSILLLMNSLTAQYVDYDDVAVIVNNNSPTSVEIGEYFKSRRSIPDDNMIYINCSDMERIDSTELFSIVNQVSDYLTNNNLTESINYLVTTKGVPLIYEGGNCDTIISIGRCSSVDSELALIINHNDLIGVTQIAQNPYFKSDNYNFSRDEFDIFLVTRLDGYTIDDVKSLINRSGPDLYADKANAQFIFDLAFSEDTITSALLGEIMEAGNDVLQSKNWNTIFSPSPTTFITDESNVLGYYSYIYNPSNKILNNDWMNGSIANLGVGVTAFTFDKEENIYNELILANLIEEGACGASGMVHGYFLSQGTVWPEVLFEKYTYGIDTISQFNIYYNLAESYWNSISVLSSVHVVVGDPKTSIVLEGPSNVQISNEISHFKTYPVPANDMLTVEYTIHKSKHAIINMYNIYGSKVHSAMENISTARQSHTFNVSDFTTGIYIIELISGKNHIREKILIE